MPCFHGLAVSIHTPDGPIAEYSIQRQNKFHRISTYIPVPPPKANSSGIPEQSTFAISITLLTPGISVPYSTPKATPEDPYPRPKIVGTDGKTGAGVIAPYGPITNSPNETIAAYIYFDGRTKEEVATLLRRGEETWVNSRWVSVPDTEGGGLAEREFLFREVGLERWLNGLDLEGNDAEIAAKIERRRKKLEKKMERRKKIKQESEIKKEQNSSDEEDGSQSPLHKIRRERNGVLRYGEDRTAPVESITSDDSMSDDSLDEEIPSEAAGQIKVALFRVLASGEIKRGEYSPQFDAHDDDDLESQREGNAQADVDHTTSFAKPKSLDPKTISTQTVTGIDPPDKPYAVFTFFYRGEKQLQKMGMLPSAKPSAPASATKRKSATLDFSNLTPLKGSSTVKNFSGYRDTNATEKHSVLRKLVKSKGSDDEMDSEGEDLEEKPAKSVEQDEEKDDIEPSRLLSPEDAERQKTLADGVKKINLLKRQASADPLAAPAPNSQANKSPTPAAAGDSPAAESSVSAMPTPKLSAPVDLDSIGSPFKRARASDAGTLDVSGARKASELFSNSLNAADSPNHEAVSTPIPDDDEEL